VRAWPSPYAQSFDGERPCQGKTTGRFAFARFGRDSGIRDSGTDEVIAIEMPPIYKSWDRASISEQSTSNSAGSLISLRS
jgi:hypothetical protein